MEVITVINRKGGVGKTITCQTLGAGLARKGFKVLFVDLDSQTNLSYGLKADLSKPTSMDILKGSGKAGDAIQKTKGGDIIPGSEALAGADIALNETGKEYRLKEALAEVSSNYDYCIIDTPAALGTLTVNALTAADSAIIPVQADIYSLQGIAQLSDIIGKVSKYCNPKLKIDGILLTRFSPRAILSRDIQGNMEKAAEHLKTRLYKVPIREGIVVKECQALQQDIFSYAPKSNAAKDYESFIKEFLEKRKVKKK